jgi:hypothetical protein
MNKPLVADYTQFDPSNFLDVLRGSYKGFCFNDDLLKINSIRKQAQIWPTLTNPNRIKVINNVKILCNVYDSNLILRFFLFNLDVRYHILIITIFSLQHTLPEVIMNINGFDIVTNSHINTNILFEGQPNV